MESLKRRNPPKTSKTSKTENFNAEILHSPYREGMVEGKFAEVAATDVVSPVQQSVRTNDCLEAAALLNFLKSLAIHADLAWCKQLNRDATSLVGHLVRFGSQSSPSVRSPLKGDHLLGVEVESATAKPSPNLSIFSMPVPTAGAEDLVARDLGDVLRELTGAQAPGSNGTPSGYSTATVERTENKKVTLKGHQ
ncbi:hypothetical protein SAMN05216344_11492 [Polaromonas sp. OV174]|uniref:hypothetical protein n=1 Tax=Polaromonas sp. OV174 TaxID=1855300 RepID=UPI0008E1A90A|nr:hypothetical protein [Polaromonas sp. OV174]SFC33946.1 hypothetical protein SAMN05216344_11492 [Polaromonas sp. OV174]